MAKTKAGPVRHNRRARHNNYGASNNKKHMQNGLYVHSSPPKALSADRAVDSARIKDLVRSGDVAGLEGLVLEGQGGRLLHQPATHPRVRAFLKTVPSYMSKIELVHDAASKGNLRELKALLDRRKLAQSKDEQGVGVLHKAVLKGHTDVVDYLITEFPESLDVSDNKGRTPLHYCAASKSPDEMYTVLCEAVEDAQIEDMFGNTPAHYMSRPDDIRSVKNLGSSKKSSGGSKGKRRSPPKRVSPLGKITTPPKREGMNITGANIRIWIHDQDLPRLEQIVWEGEGNRLLQETSNHPKVRQFLNLVPRMMTKIKEVHQAALNDDLETLDAKVETPEILVAKDQNGLNPLHKAAALGNMDVVAWIVQRNQSTVFGQDKEGRTPLFYAAVAKDGGEGFSRLLRNGADPQHVDKYHKTAEHYRFKPSDLDLSVIRESPTAPRSGGPGTLDIPMGTSRAPSNQNSRAPSRNNHRSRNPSRRNSLGDLRKGQQKEKTKGYSKGEALNMRDLRGATNEEVDASVRDGDLMTLEDLVLSGRGNDLRGRSAWNEDTRRFLKRIPAYMEKMDAVHDASGRGDIHALKRLTKDNPRLVLSRGVEGALPLHMAASASSTQACKHLLNLYPPALHIKDQNGKTPLHYAGLSTQPGARGTYELLLREGASGSVPDMSGTTPDDYREAIREAAKRTPSRGRVSRGGAASLGPSRSHSQESPDRVPSREGVGGEEDEEVERAIAAAEGDDDYSLLTAIVVDGKGERLLGRTSKDPGVNDFLKKIPGQLGELKDLHTAAETGDTRRVMGLLDSRKKATFTDHNHANILHKAVLHDHTDLAEELATHYPELLQQKDLKGRTPLHYAAVAGREQGPLYFALREAGADTTMPDADGYTPEDYLSDPSLLTEETLKEQLARGLATDEGDGAGGGGGGRGVDDGTSEVDHKGGGGGGGGGGGRGGGESQGRPYTMGSGAALIPTDLKKVDETYVTRHDPAEDEVTLPDPKEPNVVKVNPEEEEGHDGGQEEGDLRGETRGESRGEVRGESRGSVRSEFPGMWTDDGKYLAEALGDALIKSLSDVNEARPKDPISYLACCLYSYRYNNDINSRTLPPTKDKTVARKGGVTTSDSTGSGHSSIAMKTAVESTGGGDDTPSPQKRDRNGQSVLHFAAGRPHGRSAFYRLLEEAGCSLADRDHLYQTPRDVALRAGLMENVAAIDKWVVNLAVTGNVQELRDLVLGGYDQMFEVTDSAGRNLMEIAHLYGQERIVHFLTEAMNFLDKRDWLHKAIRVGSLPHVQYIADTEDVAIAKDTKSRTSLHLATLCEETEIMQFLATQYPRLLMTGDNLERTPLHYAMAVEGVDRVAKVLVQAGARRAMRDLREKLPSYYFMNREEIVAMIKEVTVEEEE